MFRPALASALILAALDFGAGGLELPGSVEEGLLLLQVAAEEVSPREPPLDKWEDEMDGIWDPKNLMDPAWQGAEAGEAQGLANHEEDDPSSTTEWMSTSREPGKAGEAAGLTGREKGEGEGARRALAVAELLRKEEGLRRFLTCALAYTVACVLYGMYLDRAQSARPCPGSLKIMLGHAPPE